MEYVAGVIGLLLLLWICSGSSKKSQQPYSIRETGDERYSEVIDNRTERVEFVGTHKACEMWIEDHK